MLTLHSLRMKQLIKKILATLNISLTRNQRYDAYTRLILERSLKHGSNCIDIGCHKGEILDLMLKWAPQGMKFGFEPIPELYHELVLKYQSDRMVSIFPIALYDHQGKTSFQHVLNAPAYSGIKQRKYDGKQVEINQITVETDLLDNLIPENVNIDLIKIDVEGAEFPVMQGGVKTIRRSRPVIIFEFGMGAADFYDSKPGALYQFLHRECNLHVSTLKGLLDHSHSLSENDFKQLFENGKEYYFVAHP